MKGFTLTIASKIKLISVIFGIAVVLAIGYLSMIIGNNAKIISEQSDYVDKQFMSIAEQSKLLTQQKAGIEQLKLVNDAAKSFADMRFWLYDLSVSWLNNSESNAEDAKEKLLRQLQTLATEYPDISKNISAEVELLYKKMIEAVDAYVDQNRVLGNSLVAKVRERSNKVDQILTDLQQQVQQEANEVVEKAELAGAAVTASGQDVRKAANQVVGSNRQLQKISLVILVGLIMFCVIFSIVLLRAICTPIESLRSAVKHVESRSDLTHRVAISSKQDELGVAGQAFNQMMSQFQSIVTEVSSAYLDLNKAIEQTTEVMMETNTSVTQQQLATDLVATAINQMSTTVQEVASNASNAADAAASASDAADNGHHVVEHTIKVIESLSEKVSNVGEVISHVSKESANIGTVLDVIRGVSEQTNLLALNAAIEAARAGEAGRGFAVVADEVRTLAQRTQESTQEIQSTIERLQVGIEKAVHVMQEGKETASDGVAQAMKAGGSLKTITQAVMQINELNSQIATAAEQQAVVNDQINQNIVNIRDLSAQTSMHAQQTTSACNKQQSLSNQLAKLVSQFKV